MQNTQQGLRNKERGRRNEECRTRNASATALRGPFVEYIHILTYTGTTHMHFHLNKYICMCIGEVIDLYTLDTQWQYVRKMHCSGYICDLTVCCVQACWFCTWLRRVDLTSRARHSARFVMIYSWQCWPWLNMHVGNVGTLTNKQKSRKILGNIPKSARVRSIKLLLFVLFLVFRTSP